VQSDEQTNRNGIQGQSPAIQLVQIEMSRAADAVVPLPISGTGMFQMLWFTHTFKGVAFVLFYMDNMSCVPST